MNFIVPDGHFLVSYDYGMGGLWWLVKAESRDDIQKASNALIVHDKVPDWMSEHHWNSISFEDLNYPQCEGLRMVLARQS